MPLRGIFNRTGQDFFVLPFDIEPIPKHKKGENIVIDIVFQEFERVLSERKIGQCVLEIGAVPTSHSLLNLKAVSSASERIGINLDSGASYKLGKLTLQNDYRIIKANANNMTCFQDNMFDTVLCNSTLEHDKYFWKTVSEIRRVAKEGALIVIGTPGYDNLANVQLRTNKDKIRYFLISLLKLILSPNT